MFAKKRQVSALPSMSSDGASNRKKKYVPTPASRNNLEDKLVVS